MAEKISLATARILGDGVLYRNGLDGRINSHNGASDADYNANHVGQDLTNAYVMSLFQSPESSSGRAWLHGAIAERDRLRTENGALKKSNSDLLVKAAELQAENLRLKGDIETLTEDKQTLEKLVETQQKQITDLQAQLAAVGEDTGNLNQLGVLLRWIIQRLGLSK